MTSEDLTLAEPAKLAPHAEAVNDPVQHGRMFFNTNQYALVEPGESCGNAWVGTLSDLALRLKIEVHGPRDRRQGPKEWE